ncbi:DUF1848 domain-containing protein [Draconibacterium orientale]|uniref:DUF1848 domain-containing protein n=1 Tax=Draconibacterium orientale TaxID=1168034 RepID=UPI002A0A4025|nr:DUF1848 domain-containing protein [Draconibacterium orientale]
MILSISRRTDIPAFYSDWFFQRVKEGFVYVRNPMNIHHVSRIPINTDVVDCMVFWSKNPAQMLTRLNEIAAYNYYFQFTVNPYSQNLECNVPKKGIIFDVFKKLSDTIGPNKVIWRYDPILLSNEIDISYHLKYFEVIAKTLSGYTKECVISFIDSYKKTERNLRSTTARELKASEINTLCRGLANISSAYGLTLKTCAEAYDLQDYGISHGRCIDNVLIEKIIGKPINSQKDKNQRDVCGCISSIDIGEYNTCKHNCLYCYANYNQNLVEKKSTQHNPKSPLLIGDIGEKDVIRERKVASIINKNALF